MYNSLRPSFFGVYAHNILQAFGSCADWVLRADKYGPTYVQFPVPSGAEALQSSQLVTR